MEMMVRMMRVGVEGAARLVESRLRVCFIVMVDGENGNHFLAVAGGVSIPLDVMRVV